MIKDINAITPEYLKYRIELETKLYKQEIEILNNKIYNLEKCNKDYYKMINTCTSKLSRIRERVSYEETNAESLSDDILTIINDKEIFEWKNPEDLYKIYINQKEEIERLNNIINKALEKSKGLQYRFGYVLDDLIYILMQGSDKE